MTPVEPLELVTYHEDPTHILQADLSDIEEDPKAIAVYLKPMADLCRRFGGVGLAAPQAGLRHNFFYATRDARISRSVIGELCINPKYVANESGTKVTSHEGCLSIPGVHFKVARHAVINAQWHNAVGHVQKVTLRGIAAVVFQHECDHLRGITLIESGEVTVVPQPT